MQREAERKTSANGYPILKAVRRAENALLLKSFFIDIDVKDPRVAPDKQKKDAYPTTDDALRVVENFCNATGLPSPNIIVNTGSGGLHIHWVLSEPISVEVWSPLAHALAEATRRHGLKCDTQCTVDAARIMRVPGTWNRKYAPDAPVVILQMRECDYMLDKIAAPLAPYKGANVIALRPATDDPSCPAGRPWRWLTNWAQASPAPPRSISTTSPRSAASSARRLPTRVTISPTRFGC